MRTPAFWVSKKPIGTKAHNETIQSKKNLAYRVSDETLFEKVKQNIRESNANRILVIANTVSSAKKLYDEIKESIKGRLEDWEVYFLHSRLGWKMKDNILKRLKEEEKWILVSTQVVEAAIDIDADFLITIISPIPSQIQRWGRVFRNREKDYSTEHPNITIIYWRDDWKLDREFIGNIYTKESIQSTVELLNNIDENEILTYEEERELVKEFYEEKMKISEDEVEGIFKNLPYVAVEITTRKEAHGLFRPEDWTTQVVLVNEVEEIREKLDNLLNKKEKLSSTERREIMKRLLESSHTLPIFKKNKLENSGKLRKYSENKVFGMELLEVVDYKNSERIVKEYGLEFLLETK